MLSAFFRAFALFLLLSQLFGFDGGNAFFLGDGFNRRVVVADEIEMNINVLLAVNGSTACGFVNLNPVNSSQVTNGQEQDERRTAALDPLRPARS